MILGKKLLSWLEYILICTCHHFAMHILAFVRVCITFYLNGLARKPTVSHLKKQSVNSAWVQGFGRDVNKNVLWTFRSTRQTVGLSPCNVVLHFPVGSSWWAQVNGPVPVRRPEVGNQSLHLSRAKCSRDTGPTQQNRIYYGILSEHLYSKREGLRSNWWGLRSKREGLHKKKGRWGAPVCREEQVA